MQDIDQIFLHLPWLMFFKAFIQVFIILYALVWVWRRIVGTQAERLVKGVMVLIAVCLLSYFAGFTLITTVLQHVIPATVLGLLIIFQPEIRRGLGYLGRIQTFKIDLSLADSEKEAARRGIEHIIAAVRELARTKVGALLVIEPPEGERDYLSPGTPVNADISKALLLAIFFPNSPLHDGAVVIRGTKIVAAGVILPITDNPKLSYRYGTRHRAALGLSELYDGLCIVVSEETGAISAANRGMLVRYNSADDLADPLSYLYHQNVDEKGPTIWGSFVSLFKFGKSKAPVGTGTPEQLTTTEEFPPPRNRRKDDPKELPKDSAKESSQESAKEEDMSPGPSTISPPEPESVL